MKRLSVFVVSSLLCGFLATPSIAQEGESDEPVIVYDPLFWKSELRLKNSQCQSIEQINSEYYELIESTVRNSDISSPELIEIAKGGLSDRSQKIWDTLHANQKKKWLKLWQNQYTGP